MLSQHDLDEFQSPVCFLPCSHQNNPSVPSPDEPIPAFKPFECELYLVAWRPCHLQHSHRISFSVSKHTGSPIPWRSFLNQQNRGVRTEKDSEPQKVWWLIEKFTCITVWLCDLRWVPQPVNRGGRSLRDTCDSPTLTNVGGRFLPPVRTHHSDMLSDLTSIKAADVFYNKLEITVQLIYMQCSMCTAVLSAYYHAIWVFNRWW